MRLVRAACAGLSLLSLVALWPAMPDAQSGRAMTIDDLIGAVRVADPQLSPDGRTVALRADDDRPEVGQAQRRHLGRAGRRRHREGARSAATSPRTRRAGARRQAARVHLHSRRRRRRSTSRMPTAAASARSPSSRWARSRRSSSRPTARRIAFVSDVYPECADEACNKRRKEEIEKNPVKVRRLTRLL